MPGSSPTIERLSPIRRLNNVDLPTLGRPTIATSGVNVADLCVSGNDIDNSPAETIERIRMVEPGAQLVEEIIDSQITHMYKR
jgi:hypothetical protein